MNVNLRPAMNIGPKPDVFVRLRQPLSNFGIHKGGLTHMGKRFEELSDVFTEFIERQHIFSLAQQRPTGESTYRPREWTRSVF